MASGRQRKAIPVRMRSTSITRAAKAAMAIDHTIEREQRAAAVAPNTAVTRSDTAFHCSRAREGELVGDHGVHHRAPGGRVEPVSRTG